MKLDIHSLKIAIHDNQTCLKQSNLCFFFTKLYVSILLNLGDHLHIFYCVQNCVQQCQFVKLKLLQNLLRKHDYVAYLKSVKADPKIENGTYLWLMFLIYHILAWRILKNLYQTIFFYKLSVSRATNIIIEKFGYIGGGKVQTFSSDELKPYILSTYMKKCSNFKFHSYVPKQTVSSFDSYNISTKYPLALLVPKLTVPDLRIIAACHGLYTHSKSHLVSIQERLINHECNGCSEHISIFEPVVDKDVLHKNKLNNFESC